MKTSAVISLGLVTCAILGSAYAVNSVAPDALQWPSFCIGGLIFALAAFDAWEKWTASNRASA